MAYFPRLISRGAEAEIYLAEVFGNKVVIKRRVSKPYRTESFNRLFITSRTRTEARVITELYRAGLNVPAVIFVDEEEGVLGIEYIEGNRLSDVFSFLEEEELEKIAIELGGFAGRMHDLGIYHGDYTIANVIVSDRGLYVIDFGLAGYSTDIEEYAIDLHLMLRSVHAVRPEVLGIFEKHLLKSYLEHYRKDGSSVIKRLQEVRTRGRYVDRELRKSVKREKYVG